MKYDIKTNEHWNTTLVMNIDKKKFDTEYSQVMNLFRKQSNIPGFRPGKAPKSLIEKKYSHDVESETISRILPEKYSEILKENEELHPITQPMVTDVKKENDEVIITIIFDSMPKIEIKGYDSIELDVEKKEVNDDMLNTEIEKVRKNYAKMDEKKDELMENDVALVDFKVFDDKDKEMEELSINDYSVELNGKVVYPEITNALIGKKNEDIINVDYTYADDFQDEKLRNKKVRFNLLIKKTFTRTLPEMNDEFATNFGMKNMEQVKTAVKNNLQNEFDRDFKAKKEENLFNDLIEKNKFNVPASLVNAHMKSIVTGMGGKDENKLDDKMKAIYKPYAEWRAKREIILNTLIKQEKILVDDKEIEEEIKKMKKHPDKKVRDYAEKEDIKDNVKINRLYDKAMNFLSEKVTIKANTENKGDKNASDTNGS